MSSGMNLFEHVKSNIKISDYVRTLPNVSGLHSVGPGRWRCNNVISNGKNKDAMMLDDDSCFFKAFSHGNESGDVISLYSLVNGDSTMSPKDAAIALASEMGISIDPSMLRSKGGMSKSVMSDAMDKLADSLHDYLINSNEEDAVAARKYLHDRGMPDDMRDEWRLGLFPSFMGDAMDMVNSCGSEDIFQKTGIISTGNRPIVVMSGRLAFPIMSGYGKCISFSSRTIPGIESNLEDSKYINTSSTPIYQKREVLYGMHLYKRNITNKLIICEGNMDVLAINYETPNDTIAVATCGTALTEEHISWVKKSKFNEVIFNFDSDEAGKDATSKSLWAVNHLDNIKVSSNAGGKDPWDSFESGENIGLYDNVTPLITFVSEHASHKRKQDMLNWFQEAYSVLNFDDDKQTLVSETERLSGVNRRQLLGEIKESRHSTHNNKPKPNDSLSPTVKSIVSAMLSMPLSRRKVVFFPFFSQRTANKAVILAGVSSDYDITALRIAMGKEKNADGEISSEVFSLTPDEEESDAVLQSTAKNLALRIRNEWSNYGGVEDKYLEYISPISNICGSLSSQQISGEEQLFVTMNCISSIIE